MSVLHLTKTFQKSSKSLPKVLVAHWFSARVCLHSRNSIMATTKASRSLLPTFPMLGNGEIRLSYSDEGRRILRIGQQQKYSPSTPSESPDEVKRKAVLDVERLGGNVDDVLAVLGQYSLQFGLFKGQKFLWLLENGLGYAGWLVDNMRSETATTAALSVNKQAFKKYLLSFKQGEAVVNIKAKERKAKLDKATSSCRIPINRQTPGVIAARMKRRFLYSSITPSIQKKACMVPSDDITDEELLRNVELIENDASLSTKQSSSTPDTTLVKETRDQSGSVLIEGWKQTLPLVDHQWVSSALFRLSAKGKHVFENQKLTQLWFYPPQPSNSISQPPAVNRYFAHRLLLWAPRKLWQVKLVCPNPECENKRLTGAGIYPRVRQVLDIDSYYILAAEYLECLKCSRKLISWSAVIIEQLDIGHQLQFPVLITHKYACDVKVVRLLRARGLGNSSTQLQRQLEEQHHEAWLAKCAQYLSDWQVFIKAQEQGLLTCEKPADPPPKTPVPKPSWLLTAYCQDVLSRLEEVKAQITSTFGRVLKIDSTKKIVKKLSGNAAFTAQWATNVGNEFGQVLISVLTAAEGRGLLEMARGLTDRYKTAGVSPPELIYTDRDCCGSGGIKALFPEWSDIIVRLDIWHFMRRIASACTTESHPLYTTFMARLSQSIFEWSHEDILLLRQAKGKELGMNADHPAVISSVTKKELARHCRRRTRGAEETSKLLVDLLKTFSGEQGKDTLGVPLLNIDKVWDIWESQKHHVECIQDPNNVKLYIQTGTLVKGGVTLPVFRCSRGSTSLESFHLHLNRFIPGVSANDVHFQAYLLEGLMRWNKDRESSVLRVDRPTYNSRFICAVNNLSKAVLGKVTDTTFSNPNKYTGEKVGIEYLYSQTGKVLQENDMDEDKNEDLDIDDEGFHEIEADDQTIPPVENLGKLQKSISSFDSQPALQSNEQETALLLDEVQEFNELENVGNSSSTSSLEEEEESVGPDGVAGYGKVCALAKYLCQLRTCTSLNTTQADKLIKLWSNLSPHDKKPATFSPRFRPKLTQGRFKVSKSSVTPGVESTRRCFLGQNGGPAQKPDCNRYMEVLITMLCEQFPGSERRNGKTILRWSLVGSAYSKIRNLVISNQSVMENTKIQLVEINQATLSKWYNKRSKKQEKAVLEQGLPSTPASFTKDTLPSALPLTPTLLPAPTHPNPHQFTLPPNTSHLAKRRLRFPNKTIPIQPNFIPLSTPFPPNYPSNTQTSTTSTPIPYSTKSYRKRKLEQEKAGEAPRRYRERVGPSKCSKCGQPRTGGHTQFFGNWYCPSSEETYEQWRTKFGDKYTKQKQ